MRTCLTCNKELIRNNRRSIADYRRKKFCNQLCKDNYDPFFDSFKINDTTDCWEWMKHLDKDGYGKITVSGKVYRAHRYSLVKLKCAEISEATLVLHKCDNPKCVNPEHLYIGNQLRNLTDMVERGRSCDRKGVKNTQSILSDQIIRNIRSDERTHSIIAKQYGTTRANVSLIKSRKRWSHVY